MLNIEFLESKEFSTYNAWGGRDLRCTASSGNIHRISEEVFSFTQYNFLPTGESQLDGHYDFYVNVKTFEYLIYQNSYYGGLTYVTKRKSDKVLKLNVHTTKIVEAIIASKLLGAYFYDTKFVNSQGSNLINDGTPIKKWAWADSTSHTYPNGAKTSLICDWRHYPDKKGSLGHIGKEERFAIKTLTK